MHREVLAKFRRRSRARFRQFDQEPKAGHYVIRFAFYLIHHFRESAEQVIRLDVGRMMGPSTLGVDNELLQYIRAQSMGGELKYDLVDQLLQLWNSVNVTILIMAVKAIPVDIV